MSAVVERLHEVINDLDALNLDTLTDAEMHDVAITVQRQRARLGAVAAKSLARWDSRAVWSGDRSRSAASRLARETRCSAGSAKVELRRARKLTSMPATAPAVTAGELALDHVDLLGRANQPRVEALFAEQEATPSISASDCGSPMRSGWSSTGAAVPTPRRSSPTRSANSAPSTSPRPRRSTARWS